MAQIVKRITRIVGPAETKVGTQRGRVRNPATLAANATEGVQQVLCGDRIFHLRKPVDLSVRRKGPYYFIGYDPLGISGYGHDELEALESFADVFAATWEAYAMAKDSQLTGDARELKQKLRYLVAFVETPA